MAGRNLSRPGLPWAVGGGLWHLTGGVSCRLLRWWHARHRFLATAEDIDDPHGATATGAWFAQGVWDDLGVGS
jgi:hypothetical protein